MLTSKIIQKMRLSIFGRAHNTWFDLWCSTVLDAITQKTVIARKNRLRELFTLTLYYDDNSIHKNINENLCMILLYHNFTPPEVEPFLISYCENAMWYVYSLSIDCDAIILNFIMIIIKYTIDKFTLTFNDYQTELLYDYLLIHESRQMKKQYPKWPCYVSDDMLSAIVFKTLNRVGDVEEFISHAVNTDCKNLRRICYFLWKFTRNTEPCKAYFPLKVIIHKISIET